MDTTPLDVIRAAVEQVTGPGRANASGWQMKCPAHSDRNPSLSLGQNPDLHALLYCQAGCTTDAVLAAVGLTRRDLYPLRDNDRQQDPVVATYSYVDEQGQLLYQVLRTANKAFRQRRPDPDQPGKWIWRMDQVRRVLYRLPLLAEAIRQSQTIYVVEGEKDVHTLEGRGQVATCNPGGAGKWRPNFTDCLRGAHVIVVADRNEVGYRHARAVAASLRPLAASLTLVQPATGTDITDHLTAGLELDAVLLLDIETPGVAGSPDGGAAEPVSGPPGAGAADTADGGEAGGGPRLRLTPASSFKMRKVQWVWADRMPLGEICLIPGREGIGKSTFLAWLAAQVTRGTLPGIYHDQPRAVLYAASEDAWDYTVVPRLFAAGADLDLVYRVDVVEDSGIPGKLTLPTHCRLIPDKAEECKAAILMCDPILSNISEKLNPNQARELRTALEPLRDAAEQAKIAVAALAHFNKARDVDVSTMVSGSRAWVEVARATIAIARDERETDGGEKETWQVLTQTKNNLGRLDLPSLEYRVVSHQFTLDDGEEISVGRVEWAPESSLTSVEEILARKPGHRGQDDTDAGRSKADLVLDVLDDAETALSPREVADRAKDVNYENVKKILVRLANAGRIQRVGTGLYKTPDQDGSLARAHSLTRDAGARHARANAPTRDMRSRARGTPSVPVPVPNPNQNIYKEGTKGNLVPGETGTRDRDTGGEGVSPGLSLSQVPTPPERALTSCSVCYGPLVDLDGSGIHPTCQTMVE